MTFLTQKEVQSVGYTSQNLDTFGRLVVSNAQTMLDISHVTGENLVQESEKTTGAGSSTYINNCSIEMKVVSGTDTAIRQSRQRAIYLPGKAMNWKLTGVLDYASNASSTISRIGCYDGDNGFYFQYTGGALTIVKRSSVGGFAETSIGAGSWNGDDKLDGTGESGITLDLSKTQIFAVMYSWLGVGSVRCGVLINEKFYILHTFRHANSETDPYIEYGSLTSRYEIISAGGAGSLLNVCASAQSEGGYNVVGRSRSVNAGIVKKDVNTNITPCIAIRIKSGELGNVQLQNFNITAESKQEGLYETFIFRDKPDTILTGVSWVSIPNSIVEYDIVSTELDITDGELFSSGYRAGNTRDTLSGAINSGLGKNIDDVSDIMVICFRTVQGTDDVLAAIEFTEAM